MATSLVVCGRMTGSISSQKKLSARDMHRWYTQIQQYYNPPFDIELKFTYAKKQKVFLADDNAPIDRVVALLPYGKLVFIIMAPHGNDGVPITGPSSDYITSRLWPHALAQLSPTDEPLQSNATSTDDKNIVSPAETSTPSDMALDPMTLTSHDMSLMTDAQLRAAVQQLNNLSAQQSSAYVGNININEQISALMEAQNILLKRRFDKLGMKWNDAEVESNKTPIFVDYTHRGANEQRAAKLAEERRVKRQQDTAQYPTKYLNDADQQEKHSDFMKKGQAEKERQKRIAQMRATARSRKV